jgi:LexA-binding, inner membrane-associated putative hydrolase
MFVVGVSLVYCSLSAGFSLISTILPDKMILLNPIENGSLSIRETVGHFVWGAVAGIVTLKLRYILLGGLLAVLIDSDHLVGLLHVEGIPKMSHSITFAILATIVLLLVFSRKDYRLAAIVSTSVLTHISYDMFAGGFGFPVFTPFVNKIIDLPRTDWLILEISAICIVGIVSFIVTRKGSEKIIKNDIGR